MSNEVLQSVQLPLLLEAVSSIVGCHAHFVSPASDRTTTSGIPGGGIGSGSKGGIGGERLLLVTAAGGPNLDELPGSSITLSIVFGVLSAVLGGGREVRNNHYCLVRNF